MNAIVYCRVSSKEQLEGTSLDSQAQACRDYAQSHHITILKTFVEQGESAKFADRTQLLELIDFCRTHKGEVDGLLVWKVDRFARNVGDHFSVKATLSKYGVKIVSVTEPIDSNPEGRLMETILAGFAQFDNDVRAMRTVQGMRRRLQEGIFPWKPPFGYRSVTTRGDKKTAPDKPDPALFPVLQKAWRIFATGGYTKADIERLMATWGVVTTRGRPISAQWLDWFFRNPYYAGILVDPWSGAEYPGQHLPLVTREEFLHVQAILAGRSRSLPHVSVRPEFPLRGTARCPACEHYLTASFTKGRSCYYPYYHCHGDPRCPQRTKSHPAKAVHREFETLLESVAPAPELLTLLGDVIVRLSKEQAEGVRQAAERRVARQRRIDRELQELIRMRAQSLITTEEFLATKNRLSRESVSLHVARPVPVTPEQARRELAAITAPLHDLRATWEALPVPVRGRFVQLLLPTGFVLGKSRTAELGLLFRLSDASADAKSNVVRYVRENWNCILADIGGFFELFRDSRIIPPRAQEAVRTS